MEFYASCTSGRRRWSRSAAAAEGPPLQKRLLAAGSRRGRPPAPPPACAAPPPPTPRTPPSPRATPGAAASLPLACWRHALPAPPGLPSWGRRGGLRSKPAQCGGSRARGRAPPGCCPSPPPPTRSGSPEGGPDSGQQPPPLSSHFEGRSPRGLQRSSCRGRGGGHEKTGESRSSFLLPPHLMPAPLMSTSQWTADRSDCLVCSSRRATRGALRRPTPPRAPHTSFLPRSTEGQGRGRLQTRRGRAQGQPPSPPSPLRPPAAADSQAQPSHTSPLPLTSSGCPTHSEEPPA